MKSKKLLTYQDLCEIYSCHRDTIRAAIKRLPVSVRKTCISAFSKRTIRFRPEILDFLDRKALQLYLFDAPVTNSQPVNAPAVKIDNEKAV
jgi:hypothetical protein